MKEHSLKSVAFATKTISKTATLFGLPTAAATPALGAPTPYPKFPGGCNWVRLH
jgi:hypothetical protein